MKMISIDESHIWYDSTQTRHEEGYAVYINPLDISYVGSDKNEVGYTIIRMSGGKWHLTKSSVQDIFTRLGVEVV